MAQRTGNISTPQARAVPVREGATPTSVRPRRRDLVETVWALFCSVRFAVVLNVGGALAAMLGTVIPQMPVGIQNFPPQLDSFLQDAHSRYGDFSSVLYWAGFYDLFNSLWFRILVVLVVFSITMCTLNRWGPIRRLIREPVVRVPESFVSGLTEQAQFRAVPVTQEAAEASLQAALKKSRYRTLIERTEDGITHIYGDRDRWTKLVTFVSHAALVAIILVAAGLTKIGWREQSVFFYPGQAVDVGHGLPFTVRSDHFSIDYYPDGTSIKEYKDTLTVIQGGKDVLSKTIVVNDPLRYDGVNYFLVSYQPILFAKVTDSSNQAAPLRRMGASGPVTDTNAAGETMMQFSYTSQDNLPMDLIQLPTKDNHILTLQMTYYQDVARNPGENPAVFVQAYVDKNFDKTVYNAFLPRTGPLKVPGYEDYSFAFRPDTATVLEVAKDTSLVPALVLFAIMTAAFGTSLYTTFTRCWAKIVPSTEHPGTVNILLGGLAEKNKVSFERDFERLAVRLKEMLGSAAGQSGAAVARETASSSGLDTAEVSGDNASGQEALI